MFSHSFLSFLLNTQFFHQNENFVAPNTNFNLNRKSTSLFNVFSTYNFIAICECRLGITIKNNDNPGAAKYAFWSITFLNIGNYVSKVTPNSYIKNTVHQGCQNLLKLPLKL